MKLLGTMDGYAENPVCILITFEIVSAMDGYTKNPVCIRMGEGSKFPKSWTFEFQDLKHAVCLKTTAISIKMLNYLKIILKINQRSYYNLLNSAFWGWHSMESLPQNAEFRNNS